MSDQPACPDPALDELLVSPEIMTDPYPIYRRLRDEHPVFWSDRWRAWVVSRFTDVAETLRDTAYLSNERRQELLFADLTDQERTDLVPLRHYFAQKDVIGSDPPDHNRLRKLVARAFTPRQVSQLEPHIAAIAAELIRDGLRNGGPFDFVATVAHPLPVIVIAEMLGAPVADRPLFKRWSAGILGFQGTGRTTYEAASVAQKSLLKMFDYIGDLIDLRRAEPTEDLLTVLASAEEDGQRLTRAELLSTCNTLLTAGHETTTNLLGNLVHLLVQNPGQWAALASDRSLLPAAIEEALRYEAPKQRNFRRVARPHVLGDAGLRENDMLFQLIGSANRDPHEFPDPDRFDVARTPNGHLGFGAGIHFCLGGHSPGWRQGSR